MTTSPNTSMSVEEYVRQVEQAFSDLAPATRHHLLGDLDVHLSDHASHTDLVAALGAPTQYAQELRAALDLPADPSPAPRRRPRWLVPAALIAGAVAVAALAVVAIVVAVSSGSPNPSNDAPPTAAASSASPTVTASSVSQTVTASSVSPTVTVPSLLGETQASAAAQLLAAGLTVRVEHVRGGAFPSGRVIAQSPAASSVVVVGSQVTLRISTR